MQNGKIFFHSGHVLKEMNRTYITVIPKVQNPDSVNHYRPISLCNISYKIISKIMPNRLKVILPKIISPLQGGAFVLGRDIHDNMLVAVRFSTRSLEREIEKASWG